MSQFDDVDNYRGGYNVGGSGSQGGLEIREQASTFENYVSGTVQLVFMIFFVFVLISVMTFSLMGYARYLSSRKPKPGFYNPPPMLMRYPRQAAYNQGAYSTLTSRSEYAQPRQMGSNLSQNMQQQPVSLAMSQQTIDSHRTATSTML